MIAKFPKCVYCILSNNFPIHFFQRLLFPPDFIFPRYKSSLSEGTCDFSQNNSKTFSFPLIYVIPFPIRKTRKLKIIPEIMTEYFSEKIKRNFSESN